MKLTTWIEDILQALINLGGQATLTQIYEEVKRIRQVPLPKLWQHIVQDTIYQHSSDTQKFQGDDLFRKVDKGVWAVREHRFLVSTEKRRMIPRGAVFGNEGGEHMATWVEDIVQALKNLGGQATLVQIYEEVKRIRTEPLPVTYESSIRGRLEDYSSDSSCFKGKDYFRKIEKGVWALREYERDQLSGSTEKRQVIPGETTVGIEGVEHMATWLEDIVQALKNLGGQGTRDQIMAEVRRIRPDSLPASWKDIVTQHILSHSSDSQYYDGKKSDLFIHVAIGVWGLRNQAVIPQPMPPVVKQSKPIPQKSYQFPESFEEVANILRTIKQYRDYQHPDSPTWKEYVDEFFHILGFSTDDKNPRLTTLAVMGANHTPRAMVGFVHPGENFEEIVPGLPWESYLFFAANYYQIHWGILTDGLQLKIIHYQGQETNQPTYWPNVDDVIQNEKLDTFCTMYKIFSYIKGNAGKTGVDQKIKQTPHGHNGEELAERYVLRLEFWQQLLEKAKTRTKLHAKVTPTKENWVGAGIGKNGLRLIYYVRMDDAQLMLYIDRGEAEWNQKTFNFLFEHKSEIEGLFGAPLDWQSLPNKRASYIRYVLSGYGVKDQEHWDELQNRMIDAMIRFEASFRPYLHLIK